MRTIEYALLLPMLLAVAAAGAEGAPAPALTALEEFRIKREERFDFAVPPAVTRAGDKVTISFATTAFCDVTVAIEDARGRIVRHLVSGVLGPKAPPPLLRGTTRQSLVWDGKDDRDVYVDRLERHTVRVSLGLKPRFERTLFWSPHKRIGFPYPAIRAAPEGVYIAESCELDQVRLFDHEGDYLRTVYPFPAGMVDKVRGLKLHKFMQDGRTLPLKRGYCQATLLTAADSDEYGAPGIKALAAAAGRVAAVGLRLNRLAADGSSGGLPFAGPAIDIALPQDACGFGHQAVRVSPLSAVLSADGKWLYLAGYQFGAAWGANMDWMNGVWRMPYDGEERPTLFVGSDKPGVRNGGSGNGQFKMVTAVACDARGRVYVADYMNDRVQIFDADGKHLKNVAAPRPASLAVHQKSGDIFVFSWMLSNRLVTSDQEKVEATMTHFGPFENPAVKTACPLPLLGYGATLSWNIPGGVQHRVELDSWSEKPRLWILNGKPGSGWDTGTGITAARELQQGQEVWAGCGVRIYEEADGKLVERRDFAAEARRQVERLAPPVLWRQRLVVNPASGKLYVLEGDSGVMKSVNQVVEIDPGSGALRLVELPLGAEDLCFDMNGLIYLRTDTVVARYDPATWREVPWDYGQEYNGHSFGMGSRGADLVGALPTPGHRSFNFWHLGGMDVSPRGELLVTTCNGAGMQAPRKPLYGEDKFAYVAKDYVPEIYPGRTRWGEVHLWDRHGRPLAKDMAPGMTHMNGIGFDGERNIYLLTASRRQLGDETGGVPPELESTCTLVKLPRGQAKVLGAGENLPVPLAPGQRPNRPMDLAANTGGVSGWVEGAEWFYGGVGFGARGCVCWNCRFDLDDFSRSFAPEPRHCSVAVLDSAGNLILRVGNYGNIEDGEPLVAAGGPAAPRSIGGDETALMYACYVASHTDRRLFIADAGNARILSVKLGYHTEANIPLKEVPDEAR